MTTTESLVGRALPAEWRAGWRRVAGSVPIGRRDFWAIQALVLEVAVAHTFLETTDKSALPPALYFVPSSFFFLPVVYAALKFGVRGAAPTAILTVVLTLPNLLFFHEGMERLGEAWQAAILISVGVFVGVRVDHEQGARLEAEERERARRSSEERFRELFDNSSEAILVTDAEGVVEGANPAAITLLGRSIESLLGKPLCGVTVDEDDGDAVRSEGGHRMARLVRPDGRPTTWVEVIMSAPLQDPTGRTHLQTMLHDVTLQHERQRVLEGYTRQTVAAREEERRGISRELHDGPLQSLVLLSRKLDSLADRPSAAGLPASIEEARRIIDMTADELRRIARALRPSILDDLGLVPALRSETYAFGRRSGVDARFHLAGRARPLPAEVGLMLLRVLQEALHNVERHSGASRVDVRVTFDPDGVTLRAHDNGRGIGKVPPTSDLLASGKLGIAGMQERARLLGATLGVSCDRRGGTLVEARWAPDPKTRTDERLGRSTCEETVAARRVPRAPG